MSGDRSAGTATAAERAPQRSFTATEEAIWLSERPGDPRVIALSCELEAPADVWLLNEALSELVRTKPFLMVSAAPVGFLDRRRFWAPRRDPVPKPMAVASGGWPVLARMIEQLRLSVENQPGGVCLGLVHSPREGVGDRLVLVVHHAVTDGIGALELLRELLASASTATASSAAPRRSPVPAAGESCTADVERGWGRLRPPARIARQRGEHAVAGFGYQLGKLDLIRPDGPATANDLLITATILTIEQWNSAHRKAGKSNSAITVHAPMNARPLPQRNTGIGNATGRATIRVRPGSRDRWGVLREVTQATRAAKALTTNRVPAAESAVAALRWLPAGLRGALLRRLGRAAAPWIMPTVTVSNLGPVDDRLADAAGLPFGLRSLHFLTTAGLPQGLTVTAAKLHGVLHVGVSYSRALLDDAAAEQFLSMLLDNAQQFSAGPGPSGLLTPIDDLLCETLDRGSKALS